MTFAESIRTCFSKYADFYGRAQRSELWWFLLFGMIAGGILSLIHPVLGSIFNLAILLPSLGVQVRRLHDINRTGWWILIGLIPVIGLIVLIVFYATEGTRGENDHGADPLAAGS